MKLAKLTALTIAMAITGAVAGQAQTTTASATTEASKSADKSPVNIVKYKIGTEYYPMLDRPSLTTPPITADIGDLPPPESERLARQRNRNNKNSPAPIAPEEPRMRGKQSSYTKVIDDAQWVQVVVQNADSKPIKSIDWDFAFPRYESGELVARYNVTTNVRINPGGKKTLKHKLPAGAKKCEVIKVVNDANQENKITTFEAICGKGFNDPSLLKQKQETISIKRIEYADGSVWQKKE